MQVRGPLERPADALEQAPDRAVRGHPVAARARARVAHAAVRVGAEAAAQVELGLLVGALVLERAVGVRLPGLELGARHGVAVEVDDPQAHVERLAAAVQTQVGARVAARRVVAVERPAHGARRRARRARRVELGDEGRHAQQVRQQHPLLASLVGGLPDLGQEPEHRVELVARGAQLAHRRVQVADEDRQRALRGRGGRGGPGGSGDRVHDVVTSVMPRR